MTDNIFKQMSRKLVKELEEPLREPMIARKIMKFDTRYSGLGVTNIQSPYYEDMKEAEIMYRLPDGSVTRDHVAAAVAETKILSIVEGFEVERGEFEAFKMNGTPIDQADAMTAMTKVIERENELLINGWSRDGVATDSAFEIEGLMQGFGSREATSKTFDTYGNALKKVGLAKSVLSAAGVIAPAYNLLLGLTNYGELDASVSTTGIEEYTQVKRALNPGGGTKGDIYQTSDCSTNHGILVPADMTGQYFRAYVPYNLTVSFGFDNILGKDISPIYGTALERIGIRISQPTAICRLEGL